MSVLSITLTGWSQTPSPGPNEEEQPKVELEPAPPSDAESAPASPTTPPVVDRPERSDDLPLLMPTPPPQEPGPEPSAGAPEPSPKAPDSRPHITIQYVTSEKGEREEEEEDDEQRGMFLRVAPEFSYIRVPRSFKGETRSPGVAIDSRVQEYFEGYSAGGRFEIGYGVGKGNTGGIIPRLGVGLSVMPRETYSMDILGIEHEFTAQPLWFSISPGAEIQFPYRFMAVGMDLGWAVASSDVENVQPEGSRFKDQPRAGVFARLALALRLPTTSALGAGVYGAVEGFAFFGHDMWGTKTTAAFFIELDGSR